MDRRKQIVTYACVTRLIVITVQFIANVLIPDHDANVFLYPKSNQTSSFADKTVNALLGGFIRWDAQYFMHIAKYGYTYENTLAFFPLYPLTVNILSTVLSPIFIFLNGDSLMLLVFITLNVFVFVKAALALYELSSLVLNESLAYKATILFCVNPATIFFVAPYSECLFSYLSFKSMLNCVLIYGKRPLRKADFRSIIYVVIPIALSTSTRSNGTLNIGFVVYFMTQKYFEYIRTEKVKVNHLIYTVKTGILLVFTGIVCMIPFTLVQIYDYFQFCTSFHHELPNFLVNFGQNNNFVLPGATLQHNQTWCRKQIPLAYSYIQEHYWNVGFLKYFEFKQIPNFMLALPLVTFVMTHSLKFVKLHKEHCANLGIFKFKLVKIRNFVKPKTDVFKEDMFVFIVHAVFLTMFCFFCIHVQVTTRMICSASPVIYWFGAYWFANVKDGNSLYSLFLFNQNRNMRQRYLVYYFLSYYFIGTILFVNFLPWT